jgi:hypothetical protein
MGPGRGGHPRLVEAEGAGWHDRVRFFAVSARI